MSNDIQISSLGGGLISNMKNGQLDLPFANDIYLYTLSVAGIFYYIDEGLQILEGDDLTLKREPDNEYDKYAIEVYTKDGKKLGYIPRKNNKIFARLMDGGKYLYGKIKCFETDFDEIRNIVIRIYLKYI